MALLIAAGILLIVLMFNRFWREAFHLAALIILSSCSLIASRMIYFSPRPGGLENGPTTSSFPSGHVTLTVALLGFLAILITAEWPQKWRKTIYYIAAIPMLAVATARLYFGAHWLTDILGAFCLGLFWVMMIAISYRRFENSTSTGKTFSITAPIALFIGSLIYGGFAYHKTFIDYQIYYPQYTITQSNWWQQRSSQIALYGESRLGKLNRPLNIEWLGDLYQISKDLKNQGWEQQRAGWNWRQWASKNKQRLPLVPKLFLNKPPVLVMLKPLANNKIFVLQLWYTNLTIKDTKFPLWLGTIHFYLPKHKLLSLHHKAQNEYLFNNVVSQFRKYLKHWQTKISFIPQSEQPREIHDLN